MKKIINNWTYISRDSWNKGDTITPDITIFDPSGKKKVLTTFNFSHGDKFFDAITNFCNTHTSWQQAGLDDRIFLSTGFFDKFV